MAYTPCTVATNNIAALDPEPNDVGGLTDAQLQATFDKFGADFVAWFNATHIPELPTVNFTLTLPSTNGAYSGIISSEAMSASCAVGDVLYLSTTGYNKAKADVDATLPCCAMCIEAGTGTRKTMKMGFIKNTAWAFTVGQQVYVSPTTAGAITATKPVTSGQRINPVGVAVAADTIFFNPSAVFVEV